MGFGISFAPLVPPAVLWTAIGVAVVVAALLIIVRSRGALVRAVAFAFVALALANPSLTREDRELLPSVAAIVLDKSPSQSFGDRQRQTEAARAALTERLGRIPESRSAGDRGGTVRRRDRRHAAVLGAVRRPRRRAARPRRRRDPGDRRPRARRAGGSRRARLHGSGPRAHHRQGGRARPPRPAGYRPAVRHRRPAADGRLPGRGFRRARRHRAASR